MEPVNIIIFVVAFIALLVIGRLLSSASEVHASELPRTGLSQGDLPTAAAGSISPYGQQPAAVTGAEIEFPVQLPPVKLLDEGRFNRPNILNYHFAKTDLVRGPADPDCFCDDLFIQAQDPQSEQVWTYGYTVASPAGLRQVMDDQKFDSLYFERGVVIVPRWDLKLILGTVLDEIMKTYGSEQSEVQDEESAREEEG